MAGRAEATAIDGRTPLDRLARFDLAILGTPRDYTEAKDEFLSRLEALEASGVVAGNPSQVIQWNAKRASAGDYRRYGGPEIALDPSPADALKSEM